MNIEVKIGGFGRKTFLILGQILLPGLSHLVLKRCLLGIVFLLLWLGSWYVYIRYRLTNLVLYPIPAAAVIHLLCLKEFWMADGGTPQGTVQQEKRTE